jgi:hypothetical protein
MTSLADMELTTGGGNSPRLHQAVQVSQISFVRGIDDEGEKWPRQPVRGKADHKQGVDNE